MNIDDVDNRPDLKTVLSTAAFFGLPGEQARLLVNEVVAAVDGWKKTARSVRIASADVELTAGAFGAYEEFRT